MGEQIPSWSSTRQSDIPWNFANIHCRRIIPSNFKHMDQEDTPSVYVCELLHLLSYKQALSESYKTSEKNVNVSLTSWQGVDGNFQFFIFYWFQRAFLIGIKVVDKQHFKRRCHLKKKAFNFAGWNKISVNYSRGSKLMLVTLRQDFI